MFWPDGCAGCWRAAKLPVSADRVAWLCWRSRTDSVGRRSEENADRGLTAVSPLALTMYA